MNKLYQVKPTTYSQCNVLMSSCITLVDQKQCTTYQTELGMWPIYWEWWLSHTPFCCDLWQGYNLEAHNSAQRHTTPPYLKSLSHIVLPGVLIGYTTCYAVVPLAKQNSQCGTCGSFLSNPYSSCENCEIPIRWMAMQLKTAIIGPWLFYLYYHRQHSRHLCKVGQCYYFNIPLYFYTLWRRKNGWNILQNIYFLCFTEESNLSLKLHEVDYYQFYTEKSQAK